MILSQNTTISICLLTTRIIRINYLNEDSGNLANTKIPKPKDDDLIEYPIEYDKLLYTEYERKFGSDGMLFTNTALIEKQRGVALYMIKNIGLNLIKGKSVMNVSLPVNIFDFRSLLEL
jgi:hypothetical protein